ncbi:MAG: starch-binding protein, partial [Spirochaetales bacterium]|nr:starch-binding protein [Spirochaetales bacterium]
GWDENTIIIKVAKSYNYNYIYAWNVSTDEPILSNWPGVKMTESGSDYVYSILGRTSCGVLITNNIGNKLCVSDMIASSPGTWRVTSSGIKKEN